MPDGRGIGQRPLGDILEGVRAVVLALALCVSPLGPVVCEVACAADAIGHEHGQHQTSDHHQAATILSAVSADDDHECDHPEGGPAIQASGAVATSDQLLAELPATRLADPPSLIALVKVLPIASSPPHSPPPISPLRI